MLNLPLQCEPLDPGEGPGEAPAPPEGLRRVTPSLK